MISKISPSASLKRTFPPCRKRAAVTNTQRFTATNRHPGGASPRLTTFAVPPPAAQAIAGVMGNTPIWVRPVAVALAVRENGHA